MNLLDVRVPLLYGNPYTTFYKVKAVILEGIIESLLITILLNYLASEIQSESVSSSALLFPKLTKISSGMSPFKFPESFFLL